jgi:hypothetical protein
VAKRKAAGEPAAEATGRHHNVREDFGLTSAGAKTAPASTFKPMLVYHTED